MRPRWLATLAIALAALRAACGADASLALLGTRFTPDAGFPHGKAVRHGIFIPRLDAGARITLTLRNDATAPADVQSLTINGTDFEALPAVPIGRHNPDSKWWMLWPNPVPPGRAAVLRLRVADAGVLGAAPARIELVGEGGTHRFEAPLAEAPLWMPSVGFSPDLKTLTAYAANRGTAPITLPRGGGLSLDGKPVEAALPQRTLEPGDVVPITARLAEPLQATRLLCLAVAAEGGQKAVGALRVFPSRFGVTFWGSRYGIDEADAVRHHIDRDIPGYGQFVDEPIGGRVPTMTLRDRIVASLRKSPQRPIMTQYTGYEENLIYCGMADVHMTHHGNTEQDLSHYLTWPRPIWYLPQNAWGRKEGIGRAEHWYPLEDLRREAFEGIAHGAKNIQWFTYINLWEQGYGRGGGVDLARKHQDFYMPGAIGNPVTWDRVGRISAALQVAGPRLAVSCPAWRAVTGEKVEVTTVLSGADGAAVALVDHRTPHGFYKQTEPLCRQRILYGLAVRARVPAWVKATRAFAIDPFAGILDVPMKRGADGFVELTVDELEGAALIILGDAAAGKALRKAWAERSATLTSDDDARSDALAAAAAPPPKPWRAPECHHRLRFEASNPGAQPAAAIAASLPLPWRRPLDPASLRVFDEGAAKPTPLPVHTRTEVPYEDFSDPGLAARGDLYVSPRDRQDLVRHAVSGGVLTSTAAPPPDRSQLWYKVALKHPKPWGRGRWIPADLPILVFDIRRTGCPHAIWLNLKFDLDADGREDRGIGAGFRNFRDSDTVAVDHLPDGWLRCRCNVERAFHQRYPDREFRGSYAFWFQVVVRPGSPKSPEAWSLRRIAAAGARLTVKPPKPLAPGETRRLAAYFNLADNGPTRPSPAALPAPPEGAVRVRIAAEPVEQAGLAARIAGTSIIVTTDANVGRLWLRHVAADGTVRHQTLLRPAVEQGFRTSLPAPMQPGDVLACSPVQPSGEGALFCFAHDGRPMTARDLVPDAQVVPPHWSLPADATVWSVDMTPDAQHLLVAQGAGVRLLAPDGSPRWSRAYPGRVFYARFGRDRIYVAANLAETPRVEYPESHILAYDLAGTELWRHKVGDTILSLSAGAGGGGLVYSRWNGQVVRLGADGQVKWAARGPGLYTWDVQALDDGGAAGIGSFGAIRIAPDGAIAQRLRLREPPIACTAAPDGSLIAFSGNQVHLAPPDAKETVAVRIGRNPRALAISPDAKLVAAGTCDGVLALIGTDGKVLWTKRQPASYVACVAFLPNGKGVAAAREVFSYAPGRMWRYRDVVEAFDLAGKPLWRHEGPWRAREPVMSQLALSADGRWMLLGTGGDVRLVDLTAAPVSNAHLLAGEPASRAERTQ